MTSLPGLGHQAFGLVAPKFAEREELAEAVTHPAFHAGWPAAATALGLLGKL